MTCSQRGWSIPSWSSRALNLRRSSAISMDSALVPRMRTPARCRRIARLFGSCPPMRHHDAVGLLALVDLQHRLEADLVEDELVALVVVGAHRLGVVVDHHGLVPELARRLESVDAAPIELHARADAVGPRTQHHHFLSPGGRGVGRPSVVAGIEVVRLRRELGGQGVDLCQVRSDAQPLALSADASRWCLSELRGSCGRRSPAPWPRAGWSRRMAATSAAARGASGRLARWRGGTRGRCA